MLQPEVMVIVEIEMIVTSIIGDWKEIVNVRVDEVEILAIEEVYLS
jgi:hypothetical protein